MSKAAGKIQVERLVYPGFWFGKTDPRDALKLAQRGVGGFCLYGGTAHEVVNLISWLRRESPGELLFCADYEDGVGQWVEEGTLLPSNMAIGASGSPALAARKAEITAREAAALGVDWILSPVVDLVGNPNNPIVNTRAFGSSPDLVVEMAGAYLHGIRQSGSYSCLKHFPGHGATEKDSHLELPVVNVSAEELAENELMPYRKLANRSDAVMVGHIMAPALDPKLAATSSSKIMNRLLRWDLRHRGRVVTDALLMGAVADWRQTVLLAVMAGADTLLAPQDPFELCDFLCALRDMEVLPKAVVGAAFARQDAMLHKTPKRPDISVVGCEAHRRAVEEMSTACLAWRQRPLAIPLRREDRVFYEELGTASQEDWKGAVFIEELRKLGIRVDNTSPDADKMLIASFFRPRAFSGSINMDAREREYLRHRAREYRDVVGVSFGSPFVFQQLGLPQLSADLCAFSHTAAFQRAAARALCGFTEPGGTMPV